MPEIFLAGAAHLLVLLHAVAAIVLIGATTHHAIVAIGYLRRKPKLRLGRIYAATIAITYAITFAFGLLAYPSFRYHTRGLYLDRYERWASNLFDMKENFAALGIPLVIAIFVLSRRMNPTEDKLLVGPYVGLSLLTAAIVWFSVISGLLITMTRGV